MTHNISYTSFLIPTQNGFQKSEIQPIHVNQEEARRFVAGSCIPDVFIVKGLNFVTKFTKIKFLQ